MSGGTVSVNLCENQPCVSAHSSRACPGSITLTEIGLVQLKEKKVVYGMLVGTRSSRCCLWSAFYIFVHFNVGVSALSKPILTEFIVAPVAEYGINVSWSSDMEHPGGLMNLTLHNNSGPWKTANNIPYNTTSYVMNGLTINVEYWFTTTWWRTGSFNFTIEK